METNVDNANYTVKEDPNELLQIGDTLHKNLEFTMAKMDPNMD